jgi:hypothetical protein
MLARLAQQKTVHPHLGPHGAPPSKVELFAPPPARTKPQTPLIHINTTSLTTHSPSFPIQCYFQIQNSCELSRKRCELCRITSILVSQQCYVFLKLAMELCRCTQLTVESTMGIMDWSILATLNLIFGTLYRKEHSRRHFQLDQGQLCVKSDLPT